MYKQEIENYFTIHADEMVEDICSLIRIESCKGEAKPGRPFGDGPADALEEVLKIAERMGFSTKKYENYVGTADINNQPKQLDILAHLDVVPAGDGWIETSPFEPLIKNGKIYGRGSADDKGPAIAALYALRAVKDLNIPLSKNARIIFGTDEECGSSDIDYYYKIEEEAPMTFSPDADFPLINIEKGGLNGRFYTSWSDDFVLPHVVSIKSGIKSNVVPDSAEAVINGLHKDQIDEFCKVCNEKTGIKFTADCENDNIIIKAKGVSAHASTPKLGNNALTGLLELISAMPFAKSEGFKRICALSSFFPHGDWMGKALGVAMSDELSGELTICLNILEYKQGELSGIFDCRAPLCATNENMREIVNAKFLDENINLSDNKMYPAHYVSEESHLVRTLLKCYEQYSGQKGKCLAIGGGTYVHKLNNGVAFGCAVQEINNHMHGADEFAIIDQLVLSAKIFAQAIIDLCL